MTESEEQNVKFIKASIRRLEQRFNLLDVELDSIEENDDGILRFPKEQVFLDNINIEKYNLIGLLRRYEEFLQATEKKMPLNLPSNKQLNALFNPQGRNIDAWKDTFDKKQAHIKGLIDGAQYIINLNR